MPVWEVREVRDKKIIHYILHARETSEIRQDSMLRTSRLCAFACYHTILMLMTKIPMVGIFFLMVRILFVSIRKHNKNRPFCAHVAAQ